MNFKNILFGALFAIVILGIEDGFNLKSYSVLVPAVLVVSILMYFHDKSKSRSK